MTGRLIGVVGPSGVGKDSLMLGMTTVRPVMCIARRVITRQASKTGERFDAVTEETFEQMRRARAFCVHWRAHGLRYGIPETVRQRVAQGDQILANLSRNVLAEVAEAFPSFVVLNLTARRATLAARLEARAREPATDIVRRLDRTTRPFPEGVTRLTLSNDGALKDSIDAAISLLYPVETQ